MPVIIYNGNAFRKDTGDPAADLRRAKLFAGDCLELLGPHPWPDNWQDAVAARLFKLEGHRPRHGFIEVMCLRAMGYEDEDTETWG